MEKTENKKIYDGLRAVPEEAKKEIQGGRLKGFTDINPMWRIMRLTEMFGPCGYGWFTEITGRNIDSMPNGEVVATVVINLYVKMEDGGWSRPIQGIGGSMMMVQEKNGLRSSDEAYKMAYTDAISVACKALGMGADVYFAKDRTKYDAAPQQRRDNADDVIAAVRKCSTVEELTRIWKANVAVQPLIKTEVAKRNRELKADGNGAE